MAVADPLLIQRAPLTHGPSYQTQPFDIDLLCSKLEVAKLEQDAERARQRLRQLTTTTSERQQQRDDTPPQFSTWGSSVHSTEKAHPRFSPTARRPLHPKQLFTALSVGRSNSGDSHNTSHFPVRSPRADGPDYYNSQRISSTEDDLDALPLFQQRPEVPNRKPVARASETEVSANQNTTQRQSIIERPGSRDTADRRSKTFPLQGCKLPLKHNSMTAYEYAESKAHKPPPARAMTTTSYDPPESPMGLVNEYTISFDLADYNTEYSKPAKQEKSQPADGLQSKSLLSLPLLMKKDKPQGKTEEVNLSPPEHSPVSPLRPSTAANNAWHLRHQSLPVDFADESKVQRSRFESQQSKRRSLVGWLKKF